MKSNPLNDEKLFKAIAHDSGKYCDELSYINESNATVLMSGRLGYFGAALVRKFGKYLTIYKIKIGDDGEYYVFDIPASVEEISEASTVDNAAGLKLSDAITIFHKALLEVYQMSIQDGYPTDLAY